MSMPRQGVREQAPEARTGHPRGDGEGRSRRGPGWRGRREDDAARGAGGFVGLVAKGDGYVEFADVTFE